ncbi:MAG: hypothetical protein Q7K13_04375 [Polynucleobacter sp.]|uniref:hypothetical protein n=1 Tax=Polynucleobacter sp. TaxID=2029855 RepID=UPI0027264270|nr:hypothetical protein [Polynucleobacter sp.]MDO8713705.1 hypothetical protein [Polynucleobacter sp.]
MIVNSTRQVITRSPHKSVGVINCQYFQSQPIVYESQLERAFVQLSLLCPGVRRIIAQPFRVNLDPIKKKHYTPDYLVELDDGSFLIVEVKILKRIAKLERRLKQINERLSSRSFPFMTADETQLYSLDKEKHVKAILRYVNWQVTPEVKATVLQALEQMDRSSISLKDLAIQVQCTPEDLLHLIATRQIFITAVTPISELFITKPISGVTHGINFFSHWFNTALWGSDLPVPQTT